MTTALQARAACKAKREGLSWPKMYRRETELAAFIEDNTWPDRWGAKYPPTGHSFDGASYSEGLAGMATQIMEREVTTAKQPEQDPEPQLPCPSDVNTTPTTDEPDERTAPWDGTIPIAIPRPVKEPLPQASPPPEQPALRNLITKAGKNKGMMANGRDSKVSKFDNWYCQVFPSDFAYPAWRALSKTATDVVNICRAKSSYSAKYVKRKDKDGRPTFEFTVSEAERHFKLTRPTFTKAIAHLVELGFIERVVHGGGVLDGGGIKSVYRLCEAWKTWEPPEKKTNIAKARAAKKQNPG